MSPLFAGCASRHASNSRRSVPRRTDFPTIASGCAHLVGRSSRQQGELIGSLNHVILKCAHSPRRQIKLVEIFADQAVIAIENVRLFQELKESLEQQTATSEILGVIASSPTDIQPVLDAACESAVRLCAAEDASIRLVDGNCSDWAAHYGTISMAGRWNKIDRLNRQSGWASVRLTDRLIHFADWQLENEYASSLASRVPSRDITPCWLPRCCGKVLLSAS